MEYYAAIKKNEILLLAVTWMDLEMAILSEVRQISFDVNPNELIYKTNRLRLFELENKLRVTKGERGWG